MSPRGAGLSSRHHPRADWPASLRRASGASRETALALRIVESSDGMTADWGYLERDLLRRISNRVINEVRAINRVVRAISPKPPSPLECG